VQKKSHQKVRSYKDICSLINKSTLADSIKTDSIGIFHIIAEAESKIHDIPIHKVHFHEIGALDSIIDIVSTAICMYCLKIDTVYASRIPLGEGTLECQHGAYPVPSPATLEILKGVPCVKSAVAGELVTPTGAGILSYYTQAFSQPSHITIKGIGYGAGTREYKEIPNMLRVVYGDMKDSECSCQQVSIIETNIDDMNPQIYGFVLDACTKAGALDVWITPVFMKKMRPAHILSVMVNNKDIERCVDIVMAETSTIGLRIMQGSRIIKEREIVIVTTKYGNARVKISSFGDSMLTITPEYDDCVTIADKHKIPLKQVMKDVEAAYTKLSAKHAHRKK